MRNLLLVTVIALLLAMTAKAESTSVTLIGGGLSYHFSPVSPNALNILNSGHNLTYDGQYGIAYTTTSGYTYTTISIFGGTNQIYDPIFGGTVAYGIHNKTVYFGGVAGGFMQNNANLTAAGIAPITLSSPNSTLGFSPIVGVELNFKFYLGEKVYFRWGNTITPGLINANGGLGFDL